MRAVFRFGQSAAGAKGGGLLKGRSGWDVVEKHLSSSVVIRLVGRKRKAPEQSRSSSNGFAMWVQCIVPDH